MVPKHAGRGPELSRLTHSKLVIINAGESWKPVGETQWPPRGARYSVRVNNQWPACHLEHRGAPETSS